jgi:hypothetical protein
MRSASLDWRRSIVLCRPETVGSRLPPLLQSVLSQTFSVPGFGALTRMSGEGLRRDLDTARAERGREPLSEGRFLSGAWDLAGPIYKVQSLEPVRILCPPPASDFASLLPSAGRARDMLPPVPALAPSDAPGRAYPAALRWVPDPARAAQHRRTDRLGQARRMAGRSHGAARPNCAEACAGAGFAPEEIDVLGDHAASTLCDVVCGPGAGGSMLLRDLAGGAPPCACRDAKIGGPAGADRIAGRVVPLRGQTVISAR